MFFPKRPVAKELREQNAKQMETGGRDCHPAKKRKGRLMKTTMLSVIGCALLAAATLNARAQSTNGTPIVTLNVNVSLTGVAPSDTPPPARVKIGTKDVIAALATD